jgi:arachidonate 5-lipoxygenase
MSHNNGIAGTGWLKILDNPDIPEHDFFKRGKQFDIRVRHGSATFLDDAMCVKRSCAIKFSNEYYKSPLDLELNTGKTSVFWSALSFLKFSFTRGEKNGVDWVKYNYRYPDGSMGAQTGGRRHATSFHNLHYHCMTPFLFIPKSGIKHYCKYKVRPFEDIEESGINKDPDPLNACNQRILPHESRGKNFLKNEYIQKIKNGTAKYKLQIQLRVASDDDDPEIFNNMKPWNENHYPYKDLAVFEVNKMLDWKESTKTTFSMKNMPKNLGVIPAKSIYDYNSLNYLRVVSDIARRARLFSYKLWGMVPPIPDNDDRNIRVWTKPNKISL